MVSCVEDTNFHRLQLPSMLLSAPSKQTPGVTLKRPKGLSNLREDNEGTSRQHWKDQKGRTLTLTKFPRQKPEL